MSEKPEKVLVTGGCGFIGQHLVKKLCEKHYKVVVIDNMDNQVHSKGMVNDFISPHRNRRVGGYEPSYEIRSLAEIGDIDLDDVEYIFHLAGSVGSAQSMYRIQKYCRNNMVGLAALLEKLPLYQLRKFILASSCVVYEPSPERSHEESKLGPTTVYGLTKKYQEDIGRMICDVHQVPFAAMRLFYVYGPGQTLENPFSGVVPLYISSVKKGISPVIYDIGQHIRDFVYVKDVVDALVMAMKKREMTGAFNVGSGIETSMAGLFNKICEVAGKKIEPTVEEKARVGDARYQVADIGKMIGLGWKPKMTLEEGLAKTYKWALTQHDKPNLRAHAELVERGLLT
jgi:dTDP-L-rhamnose 4-epimerase